MNSLICIIILQLLGRVLSDISCNKIENCSCQNHIDINEIEITCGSRSVKANSRESIIEIQCKLDEFRWKQKLFNPYDFKSLNYKNCLLNTGINETMLTLGIKEFVNLKLSTMKLNGSLERIYFSSLKSVEVLDIGNTILVLTNESFEGTPNLKKLFLRQNYIQEIPIGVFKHLINLEILDLGGNRISKIDSDLFDGIPLKILNLDSNHLTTLTLNVASLKRLDVSTNRLISISVENLNNLIELSLNKNNLTSMPDQPFKNTSLESIKYSYGNFSIPQRFLTSLGRLFKVKLVSLNLKNVPENMIWNSPNITEFSLASNLLEDLPSIFFRDSMKMIELDLSKNRIKKINRELLKPLINLNKLDLSYNSITRITDFSLRSLRNLVNLNIERNSIIQIEQETFNFPKLKYLKLAHNNISNLNINFLSFNYLIEVESIDLSYNSLTHIEQDWINLIKLKYINLESNNFTVLESYEIMLLPSKVNINLKLNPLEAIDLTQLETFAKLQESINDNQYLTDARKITLSGNKLICDCRNYKFAVYTQNQMLKIVYKYLQIEQNLTCTNGIQFSNVKLDHLMCDWKILDDLNKTESDHCTECDCYYRPFDNSALMNCSNRNLTSAPIAIITSKTIDYTELNIRNNFISKLPDYKHSGQHITKLDVGNNKLSAINITQLPKNLTELHLENNNLIKVSEVVLKDTLANLKILTMSNNSWVCDCNEKNTIHFFQRYSSKIVDLPSITCPLYTLTGDDSCRANYESDNLTIIIASISLAVFGILLALVNHYKIEIKIWLYSHNIKWPISEESLDQDKKYDAFLSYSHKDEELIVKHLVPGLEGGNTPFKLCLHLRDWVIGDWIPQQIARSVDESRRTIIVLSRNYLNSVWGRTEFRAAYSSALNEKRSRIIVILYGDISTSDLDTELKAYLSMNTYIKWGDDNFWEKLRYALPHRPNLIKNTRTKIIVPENLNPLLLT